LDEDHGKAKALAQALSGTEGLLIVNDVDSNQVKLDVSGLGLSAQEFRTEIGKRGVKVHPVSPVEIRLVTHKDVSVEDCRLAAKIINEFSKERLSSRSSG
jgi:threonine aldolase